MSQKVYQYEWVEEVEEKALLIALLQKYGVTEVIIPETFGHRFDDLKEMFNTPNSSQS